LKESADIQHKTTATAPPGFAFENGSPVPIVQPDSDDDRNDTADFALSAEQLLSVIITAAQDTAQMGERAVVLAMLMNLPAAPKSMAAFSRWLDIPHNTAKRRWQAILLYLQGSLTTGRQLPPVSDGQHE
jgi:hypothetical protein